MKSVLFTVTALMIVISFAQAVPERALPPSVIVDLDYISSNNIIILDRPDVDVWLMEDDQNIGMGVPYRIGAARDLPDNIADLAESSVVSDYGLIRRWSIHSPDAVKLQIHLQNIELPDNSALYVYAEGETEADRYTQQDVYYDGDLWTHGAPGNTIVLEWHWDEAPDRHVETPFDIYQISHIYRDLYSIFTREGGCHNDATCDLDYRPQRDATAHIVFNDGHTYVCSGVMLNNTAHDFIPYFLTANHCIGTQAVANTIQVYFFFHTQTCNGPRPPRGPRTVTGSTLLATRGAFGGSGTDYTLLRLNNADYSNIYFAGWDRNSLSNGTAVTGIHHPDGAYKRISYGTMNSTWYSGQWGVRWDRTSNPGVTEPGSSGSALFRDSNKYVVGQLWAGSSSCQNQNGRDYYGRFGNSFNHGNLGQWLGNANTCPGAYFGGAPNTPTPTNTPTTLPTHTPNPTWTPTPSGPSPTQTPMPTWTPTPGGPTHTPAPHTPTPENPTQTPNPTWTPIPDEEISLSIIMPSDMFRPGDPFECAIVIDNDTFEAMNDIPLFLILDVYGDLFFMPSATGFDYYLADLPQGQTIFIAVPMFQWPENAGAADNIFWYAGLTDNTYTRLIGNFDSFRFGWRDRE